MKESISWAHACLYCKFSNTGFLVLWSQKHIFFDIMIILHVVTVEMAAGHRINYVRCVALESAATLMYHFSEMLTNGNQLACV